MSGTISHRLSGGTPTAKEQAAVPAGEPAPVDPRTYGERYRAILVVGGQARNVGKTSLVTALIKALPERRWTAVKIAQHAHDLPDDSSYAIREEDNSAGEGDTARYLLAGARRALLLSVRPGHLADAMADLRRELGRADDAILESNSVLELLEPDVYLAVLDPGNPEFKSSARQYLQQASAVVLNEIGRKNFRWDKALLEQVMRKPIFRVRPPHFLSADLVEFVRKKLQRLDQRL